jgi:hypothetical protein
VEKTMNNAALTEVYRRIAAGEEPHGAFLTSFAQAIGQADYENFRLLRPVASMLCRKYKLTPCAGSVSPNSAALEQLAVSIALSADAKGVVMVMLHQNDRIEVVCGLREEAPDLPGLLQALADRVKDGDGQPIGQNGRIIPLA